MLYFDFDQTANGDVNVRVESNQKVKAPRLRDCLKRFEITNPLITFSNRHKGKYYSGCSEDVIQTDAWASDALSVFWKETPEDAGQAKADVVTILSRMADIYLKEHDELLYLRERCK